MVLSDLNCRFNSICTISMSGGAAPYWRAAGMTYVAYANQCAVMLRKCQKEPFKTQSATREQVQYKFTLWVDGVPQKAGASLALFPLLLFTFTLFFCLLANDVCNAYILCRVIYDRKMLKFPVKRILRLRVTCHLFEDYRLLVFVLSISQEPVNC